MTANPTLDARLLPDLETAELTIGDGSGPKVRVPMKAHHVERYIAGLADIRSKMKPEVPRSFPQGKSVHQTTATSYAVGTDALTGRPTIAFRSEGFGWLKFDLDPTAAVAISGLLQGTAEQPPNTSKPN